MKDPTDGNYAAYKHLIDQYRSSIEQECFAYESLQSPDLSHTDLVQEVTLQVWKRITQFKGLDSEGLQQANSQQAKSGQATSEPGDELLRNLRFEAWLRKTTRSILNNLYRDRKALKRNPDNLVQSSDVVNEIAAKTSSASSIAQREEERSRVRSALYKCLDDTLRKVVILHIHQNHTFPEIADLLGLTYDQVRHKYRTALKQIESELET
ncbi:MAG: sigma-70 family RNA polymerase sigma factor [Pirellulaceae bacterium]|nr:sigma-70 family RNA polymerase sigma factor [Pirellulaceae bacterium]